MPGRGSGQDQDPERRGHPDPRAGAAGSGAAQRGGGPAGVHHRHREVGGARHAAVHRGGHAAGRGRLGGPAVRHRGGAQHRPADDGPQGDRRQEHGAGGHGRQGARGGGRRTGQARPVGDGVLGVLEPRVPEGRRGGGGLHAPGPHRGGRRGRARDPADEGAVPALRAQPRPDDHHRHPLGGVHQVRGQLHAGHAHQLHERAEPAGREGGRRHRDGAGGHRLGSAHRHAVPVPGRGLRRQLLPEGREGAGDDRGRERHAEQDADGGRGGQRGAEDGPRAQDRRQVRRGPVGQDLRDVGPGVQAQHRRHARSAEPGDHQGAAGTRRQGAGL